MLAPLAYVDLGGSDGSGVVSTDPAMAAAALLATLGAAAMAAGPNEILRASPAMDNLSSFGGAPLDEAPLVIGVADPARPGRPIQWPRTPPQISSTLCPPARSGATSRLSATKTLNRYALDNGVSWPITEEMIAFEQSASYTANPAPHGCRPEGELALQDIVSAREQGRAIHFSVMTILDHKTDVFDEDGNLVGN